MNRFNLLHMYNTTVVHAVNTNSLFAAGIKLYETIKLAMKPGVYSKNDSREYFPFMVNAAAKGLTILDIGDHRRQYLFDMLKISKHKGNVVVFESNAVIYNYLVKMRQMLKLKNVWIERSFLSETTGKVWTANPYYKSNGSGSATIIDFKTRTDKEANEAVDVETIDQYCLNNSICPGLIKIKPEGNELNVLRGSVKTIAQHKPQILIECAGRNIGRERLLQTFNFLTDLKYSGYFILDTLKIPLASFDFNIYQNEILGFYCTNFIFE